ncbi:MAG: Rne/Rng family ribonuclease [Candidatus Omnitrophica bacterium]|nr:Rne/Rng family ribonuclease [Candidatus Omnitrophota bacterium]
MSREILIQIRGEETKVAIIDNGQLDDFLIEVEHYQSILGNVYKGKVESILPSINGAFVNIGMEKNGFLYLTDVVSPHGEEISGPKKIIQRIFNRGKKDAAAAKPSAIPFKEGQEILVQVVKDPFSNKGARLTTHVSLAGRFVVYMPYEHHHGISKKIENLEERHRLREVIKEFTFANQGGFIVRTVSKGEGKKELVRDAKFLYKIWQQILALAEKKKAPALIYKEYDLIWKVVRDYLTENVTRVQIDSQEDYQKLCRFVENLIGKEEVPKIQYYDGTVPLFKARGVEEELHKVYNTKVELKSGAHVVIESTEGLIVVDVNSGKFRTKAPPEEAAFMVNMEAAPEIARQLRLRDLGGIIVIDFIDMMKEGHKRRVIEALQVALAKDPAKTEVNRISNLGLVEMTRARTGKALESITFTSCPYCDGRGKVRIT